MNFLAHLFLTRSDESITVGNYLGDFLTNRQVSKLPKAIQEGVTIHRLIDQFTDEHPLVREGAELLKPKHGRYAPVVLDVMFDFLLARNWERFAGGLGIRNFADQTYRVLLEATPLMPEKIAERTERMVAADWLVHYATFEGIDYTFSRMKVRSSRPKSIENAAATMMDHLEELNERFIRFFPELINFVNEEMAKR
ncbi:MAG: hypothetical protein CMN32_13965 [Saprospirales bacterium]|jgi:acyl carrier protein phosphodiesterase|nr:hypothetical protein [Saprospirales bacterium]